MKLSDTLETTRREPHCSLCKIDFLDTGVCSAGKKHEFIAYWPKGKIELARALTEHEAEPTETLLDVVNSYNLCGICHQQCYFITRRRDYTTFVQISSGQMSSAMSLLKNRVKMAGNKMKALTITKPIDTFNVCISKIQTEY
jgi:hypothetical protein